MPAVSNTPFYISAWNVSLEVIATQLRRLCNPKVFIKTAFRFVGSKNRHYTQWPDPV
jgi:hypothetical protein